MRRDANERADVNALPGGRARRSRASAAQGADLGSQSPRKTRRRAADLYASPENAVIELITERQGVLGYRYRRLLIEQQGRSANVREIRLQLDYDLQFELATKRRDLVRVRGRRLQAAELASLWAAIAKLRPLGFEGRYEFLDNVDKEDLDETIGADGEPIAVSTGEEGPACITLSWTSNVPAEGTVEPTALKKRIVVERFREPKPNAADSRRARRAPLSALAALVDERLKAARKLNYRKADPFATLAEEFTTLRNRHFVNLRQFERRAAEAFGALKDGRAVPLLASELFSSDSRVRLQALDALGAIGDESAVPEVEQLVYDDETSVRERARKVLKALKPAR